MGTLGRAAAEVRAVTTLHPWSSFITLADIYGPVSYTHLRAHETVLDLVCRLLLEKKNNITPNLLLRHTRVRFHQIYNG